MNTRLRSLRHCIVALLFTITIHAFGGSQEIASNLTPTPADNLTLWNFFRQGWNEPWQLRSSLPNGAPDLPLFHSPTNFLFRGSRTDYSYQNDLLKTGLKDVQFLDEYVDYGLNERFMISLFGNYTRINHTVAPDQDGAAGGMIGRIQLIDTPTASTCLNLRGDGPNKVIGDKTTKLSAAIAGWQDLTLLGARRVGLYYDLDEGVKVGSAQRGYTRDDLSYDVAVAKTWTSFSAPVANFTTFVELSGRDQHGWVYTQPNSTNGESGAAIHHWKTECHPAGCGFPADSSVPGS